MNDKQIELFSKGISINDVISYIDTHKKEYKNFLENEERRNSQNES